MEYEKWERFYLQILEYFGYSQEEDERAAKILSNIFKEQKIDGVDAFNELRGSIKEREVYVFGAAPSLKKDMRRLFKRYGIETPWSEVEKERREWQRQVTATQQKDQEGAVNEEGVLASAFKQSLKRAQEKGVKTIAFPAISTGAYGFPADLAAKVSLCAVKEYLVEHPDVFEEIRLVLFNQRLYEAFEKAFLDCFRPS